MYIIYSYLFQFAHRHVYVSTCMSQCSPDAFIVIIIFIVLLDVFIIHPEANLSPINSTASFTCTAMAEHVQQLLWEVNGGQTSSDTYTDALREMGIQWNSTHDRQSGLITQLLTATASPTNNGTKIRCVAFTTENMFLKTPLVTLTVYGRP